MLQRVPTNHAMYTQTQLAVAELLLSYPDKVDGSVMKQAEAAVRGALAGGGASYQIAGRLCALAVKFAKKIAWPAGSTFLGADFSENQLRLGAEEQFRQAARQAKSQAERFHWVDQANLVRPVTLF